MAKSSRLETIKNLLELARRSDNISEAESAMQKAQLIALKEGVDLNELEKEESEESKVVRWVVPQNTKTAPTWRILLAITIAENFRVKAIKSSGGGSSQIVIIGLESDIEVFKVMFDYAETCIDVFFKKYLEEKKKEREMTRHDSLIMRNSYVDGFISGISEALKQNVECYALSLCLPQVVTNELSTMGLKTHRVKEPMKDMNDRESRIRGRKDGEAAGNRNRLEE